MSFSELRVISYLSLLTSYLSILQFQVPAELLMPWQPLDVELFHEWIRVEVLDVPYSRFAPEPFEEHHRAYHRRHTRGVAHTLHTRLVVSVLMLAVVIYVVSLLLAVFHASDAAAYARLAVVVLAQVLRIRQHGLEELQRNDFYFRCLSTAICQRSLVFHLIDARHSDVLYHVEVGQILLSEGNPEASLLSRRIILHETLQRIVVHQIAFARVYVSVGESLVSL